MSAGASIRVLHSVASLKRSSGGTSRSVPALCEVLAGLGLDVTLVCQEARWPYDSEVLPDPNRVHVSRVRSLNLPSMRVSWAPGYGRRVKQLCSNVDIAHDHGLWLPSNHAMLRAAIRRGVPLVLSPRGMLDSWSLLYRSWKKRLAWRLYQHADLTNVRAFCATSDQEADSLRALGLRQPVAVVPNGVDLPILDKLRRPSSQPRTALFLSRIHPKKGLLDLVQAWGAVRPSGWILVIAGPDEGGHRYEVENAVIRSGMSQQVRFVGVVEGDAKLRLMMDVDLFVLPTRSENFGIVVAEALACAVPVLTTRGAPWEELVECGAGWWVNSGASAIEAAIRTAISLPDAERAAMGMRGRALVERKYTWNAVGTRTRDLYAWLLGMGARPDCVRTD